MGDSRDSVGTENLDEPSSSKSSESDSTPKLPTYARPPWPIWSDEEVNRIDWDETDSDPANGTNHFTDPTGLILPLNIKVAQWVLPSELFAGTPKIIGAQPLTLDLISPNAHLCEDSKLIRHILSEISELFELCRNDYSCNISTAKDNNNNNSENKDKKFLFEGENVAFVPNSKGPWKPWDNIYSLCGAGVMKGDRAKFNPSGRYIVRLYFMGSWRQITVDDRIPLLPFGLFGLPITNNLELWPMLLTKALLKVASLSWESSSPQGRTSTDSGYSDGASGGMTQFKNFNTISCLTGWLCEWQNIPQPIATDDLWSYLNTILPKYKKRNLAPKSKDGDETDKLFNVHPQQSEENKSKEPEVEVISLKPKLKSGKSPKKMSKNSDAISGISGSGTGSQNPSVKASPKSKLKKKATSEASENGEQQQDATSTAGAISESGTSTATTDGGKKRRKTNKGGKLGKILTQPNPLPLPQKDPSNLSTTAPENETVEEPLAQCDYTSEYNLDPEMQKIINEHKQQANHQLEEQQQQQKEKAQCKDPLPTIQETLGYVQEFKGPLQQSVMKSLEKQIILDLPITVSVMFATFPLDEDGNSKGIPSHLVHPVQLAQVRDEPVSKGDDVCRAPTPRWKTFRWKEWAMKKGLIPMDSAFSNIVIKSVLSKTPFSLKNNWEITENAIFSRDGGFNSAGMSEFEQDQDQEEMEYATYLDEEAGILGPVNFPISFKIPAEATLQDLRTLVRHSRAKPPPPAPPTTAVAAGSGSRSRRGRGRAISPSKSRQSSTTVANKPGDADKKGASASDEQKEITTAASGSNKSLISKSKSKTRSKKKKKTKSKSKTNIAKGSDSKSKTKLDKKTKSKSKTKLKKSKSKVNSSRSKSKKSSKSNSKTKVAKGKKGKKKGAGAGNESSDNAEGENDNKKGKSKSKSKSKRATKKQSNEEKFNSKTELLIAKKDGGKSKKGKDGGKSGKSSSSKSRGGSRKPSSNKSGVKKNISGYASDVSVKQAQRQPDPEHACDEFWLDVDDLAHCITKLCKFYKTSSRFGSCYILRRDLTMPMPPGSEKASTRSGSESSDPANSNPDSNPASLQKTSTAELSKPEANAVAAAEAVRSQPFEMEGESDFSMATAQGLSGKWKKFEHIENVENQPVKTINVQDWQMEDLDSLDSGFYIFSDCWTEQNLTFSLDVLHESTVLKFQTTNIENGPTLGTHGEIQTDSRKPTNKKNTGGTDNEGVIRTDTGVVLGSERPITVIVKPWDWRHDCCLEGNVVVISTNQHALVHLPLLPGRNLFRLWILDETTDPNNRPAPEPPISNPTIGPNGNESASNLNPTAENPRPAPLVLVPKSHFSLKVVSKTPIRIGGREEAQNSMTDWPSVFLRQCDILARSVWALLLTFGQSRSFMGKSIRLLRQSYCTGFTASKIIQSALIRVHEAFDLQFFGTILKFNNNQMDRLMLLALRTLFINPKLGTLNTTHTQLPPQDQELMMQREDVQINLKYISCIVESRICPKILQCATLIIQRYWRGWLTRRLLQYRRRRHKYFPMIEHQIRKIAILLASNDLNISNHRKNPNVSILPRPPSWAMDIMECLLATNPWLVTVLPHAHSIPFHLKIKDVSGNLPVANKNSEWLPFYRQRLDTRGETNWTLCQFDLQTYPNETIFMQVVDNDTNSPISMVNQRLYVGKLETNELGYTILCYKMPSLDVDIKPNPDREQFNSWKLRILFPTVQHPPLILSENKYLEEMEPKQLTLYRFSGYHIPNDDLCVCRYTLDITGPLSYLSIRFKASYESVRLRLQIWNSDTKEVVFVHHARGSFLIPSIRLALPDHQENERPWDDKCELHRCHNVTILNSYLRNQNQTQDDGSPNPNDKGLGPGQVQAESRSGSQPQFQPNESEMVTRSPSQSQSQPQPPPESFLAETTGEVDALLHQNYIVGIFLEEKSWPLKDIEWKFVQYETKKFWKKMLIFRDLAGAYDHKKKASGSSKSKSKKTSKEKHLKTTGSKSRLVSPSATDGTSKVDVNVLDREIDNVSTATTAAASSVGVEQRKRSKRRKSADSTKSEKMKGHHKENEKHSKKKMLNSKGHLSSVSAGGGVGVGGGGGGGISGMEDDSVSEHETEVTFMQKKHKWLNFHGDEEDVSDEEEFELETFKTANLTIVQGGPDSQRVVEVEQPHWIFEVLMDTDQKCEFRSNRRTFQEKLIETKKGWEEKDAGRYIEGRKARHEFLAQNLVPIEKIPKDTRAYVESMSKFYSCLYLDKTQLDGLNYDDWLAPKEPKRVPLPSELSVIRSYKAIAESLKTEASTPQTTTSSPRISIGEGGRDKSNPQSKKSSKAESTYSPVPEEDPQTQSPYGNSSRSRNVSFSEDNPNAPETKRKSKQSVGSILNAENSFASSSPSRKSKRSVSSKALSKKSQNSKDRRSRRKSKKFLKFKGMKGKPDNEPNEQQDPEKDANILTGEEEEEEGWDEEEEAEETETGAESDAEKNSNSKTPADDHDSSSLDKEYPLVVTSPSQDEVVDENARYCSPPPNGPPTHILFGPPLQKCGKFKNETFSIIDRQLLTDIRGEPWKKDGDFLPTTRSTTAAKLQNWEIEHKEIREGFRQMLSEQKKEWQDFNSEITGNVFCELERNREYLEQCREYYLGTYIMRSPGRSSIDSIHSITPVEDAFRGVSEGSGTFLTSHSTAYNRGGAKSVTSEKSYIPLIFRQSDATDNLTVPEPGPESPSPLAGAGPDAGGSGGKNSISSDKSKNGKNMKLSESEPFIPTGVEIPVQVPVPSSK